jgi:hypothetical protein
MTPERHNLPDWAQQERQADFAWIGENLGIFWAAATDAFKDAGRGAIVVDITTLPMPGAGHPLGYISEEQMNEYADEDTRRMVAEYDPAQELVLVLLKPGDRSSTYRVRIPQARSQETGPDLEVPGEGSKPKAGIKLECPDIETLIAWEAEGGCEAACPHHCWVEPDGVCPHGNASWLRKLGLI